MGYGRFKQKISFCLGPPRPPVSTHPHLSPLADWPRTESGEYENLYIGFCFYQAFVTEKFYERETVLKRLGRGRWAQN